MGLVALLLFLILSCEVRRDYPEVSGIDWERSWEVALERAGREGKPVFLYFYALWCSWCREYEKVLEGERVRRALRRSFVPLILDSDRDRRLFLEFGGRGTPFTVILDPEGRPLVSFHGAVREEDLLDLMNLALKMRPRVQEKDEGIPLTGIGKKTYLRLLKAFLEDLEVRFDPVLGGFSSPSEGGVMFKWPTPLTYSFLLEKGYLLEETLFSIDKDIEFLFDEVDGGFFNFYDRTRAFDFHFETSKSLKVNGQMIGALVRAFERTGEERYLRYALRTYRYLERHLLDRTSGCYLNAQISDPEYYNLPPEKRRRLKPPPPDTAVIVEDNSRTLLSLLTLYRITGDRDIVRRVDRCLRYILENLLKGDKLYRFYDVRKKVKGGPNFGRDVAFLSLVLLERGEGDLALKVAKLDAEHDWVSYSVLAYVFARSGYKGESRNLLERVVVPKYQNPDGMVFLLRALELLVN
jgi:uncharacterized protein YyaL (SSP411 family)